MYENVYKTRIWLCIKFLYITAYIVFTYHIHTYFFISTTITVFYKVSYINTYKMTTTLNQPDQGQFHQDDTLSWHYTEPSCPF